MSEYIEREAAIAVIEEKQKELCPVGMYSRHAVYGSDREKFDAWQEIIDALERIPAADVQPVVRGKWIPVGLDDTDEGMFKCSECGSEHFFPEILLGIHADNFCPNCGADMRPTQMSGANREEN